MSCWQDQLMLLFSDKVQITGCRSSGPGGQHVNTTNTKATLRFHLESADWIPEELRKRLLVTVSMKNFCKYFC